MELTSRDKRLALLNKELHTEVIRLVKALNTCVNAIGDNALRERVNNASTTTDKDLDYGKAIAYLHGIDVSGNLKHAFEISQKLLQKHKAKENG